MRITTTRHDRKWIELQIHGEKCETLSSGFIRGLVILVISSMLGYKGFPGWYKLQPSLLSPIF